MRRQEACQGLLRGIATHPRSPDRAADARADGIPWPARVASSATVVALRESRRHTLSRLAAPAAAAGALLAGGGCAPIDFVNQLSEPQLDIARMEVDIRDQLQRRLESESRTTRGSVASVGRVRCRQRSELEARCYARVRRRRGPRLLRLEVTVDRTTGEYRWQVTG